MSRPILNLLSLFFKTAAFINLQVRALRRRSFPGLFIISADSLSFGGAGKTPLVMAIGKALQNRGAGFAVVSRGYRSRHEQSGIRVETAHTCAEVGDEPLMLKNRFPDQEVIIGCDRRRSLAVAVARGKRIVILDDGFQSSHIRKDFSVMLVNPAHPYYYLRHFRFLARRADCVLHYKPAGKGGRPAGETYDFSITRFLDADDREVEVGAAPLVAFSALGDNERFVGDMRRYHLTAYRPFSDHHVYSVDDLRSLESLRRRKGAAWMVCTEKDFVKIKKLLAAGAPLLYAQNEIQLPPSLPERIVKHAEEKGFI